MAILLLVFVNCMNMKWSIKIGDVLSSMKVLNLLILTGAGFATLAMPRLSQSSFENLAPANMFGQISDLPEDYVTAFIAAFFAYSGAQACANLAEELELPLKKTIPRSMALGFVAVTLTYVLTNVAYLTVLNPQEMLTSEAVAVTFGLKISPYFIYIIPVFVAISTFGALNTSVISNSRLLLEGGRNGQLPKFTSILNINR